MRLINTRTFHLESFSSKKKPRYGILSRRWREREVTFAGMEEGGLRGVVSSPKLCGFLKELRKDSIRFGWADTCCIDKRNIVELSEAINSMFRWYQQSKVCYAYLADVTHDTLATECRQAQLRNSRWFARGWTLQELLAPDSVIFFNQKWAYLSSKHDISDLLSAITTIPTEFSDGRCTFRTG
jgi:hypothetical protein